MITEEEIIDKAISLVTLITTNEGEETLEGDVVVEILEAIEKEDTIERTKETGPIREIGEVMVETEEDVVEEDIIIVETTETTTTNKTIDPMGIGKTKISPKLICLLFTPREYLPEEAFVHCVLIISGISENCENERNNIYKRKEQKVFKQFI